MIVALLILIVLILLFGAAAVKRGLFRAVALLSAVCALAVLIAQLKTNFGENAFGYAAIGVGVLGLVLLPLMLVFARQDSPDALAKRQYRERLRQRHREFSRRHDL